MAGKLRYWKEKDGRFWARIAVPARLRPFLDNPRGELIEPLGGDRRVALRLHPAAVAKLQQEIALAEQKANLANPPPLKSASLRTPITTVDLGRAVWQRYTATLATDDATREQFPSKAEIDAEYAITLHQVSSSGRNRAGRAGFISEGSLDNQALTLLCDCVMQTKVAPGDFAAAL
ncbi:MAG: hypothetical protein CFE33_05960 [Pseudorhodobacter sp. PARRP1]|nr:MAG: hypothetical protein CFE33_05960 [Pseudorhodobacter sp. PARRP1]